MGLKAFRSPVGKISIVRSYTQWWPKCDIFEARCIFFIVRVDVSARNPGKIQTVLLTETRRGLSELILESLRDGQYYEVREPFYIMSIVKRPMGLMVGFMVMFVVVFLMPKLMENMDPEEMWRAQEEMRNQEFPSLANFLPGYGRT